MKRKLYISTASLVSVICTLAFVLLSSCTYSINMAHTQGTATGTISDADSAAPDIAPALTIPLTTTPKV